MLGLVLILQGVAIASAGAGGDNSFDSPGVPVELTVSVKARCRADSAEITYVNVDSESGKITEIRVNRKSAKISEIRAINLLIADRKIENIFWINCPYAKLDKNPFKILLNMQMVYHPEVKTARIIYLDRNAKLVAK
jgi:hypothetical protein